MKGDVRFDKTTLPKGLRILTEKLEHVKSISLGVWVVTGSRDEKTGEEGISHCIEHMVFKGTRKRSARDIASALESLGGSLDAFTSKEVTCYYARFLDEHLSVAVDVLSDILQESLFDRDELEKEKGVIEEEIKSFHDSPEEVAFDLFFKAVFSSHPLSRPVLGEAKIVRKFTPDRLRSYLSDKYTSERVIVSATGRVHHKSLVDICRRSFNFPKGDTPGDLNASPDHNPRVEFKKRKDISQVHACIGCNTFAYSNPDRFPLLVLNAMLGGGMSSRLFQRLREEEGLVYSIISYPDLYRDSGIFGVYFASDPQNFPKSARIVLSEFERLIRDGFSKKEFTDAKSHLKGSLMISLESTSLRMMRLAKGAIYLNSYSTLDEVVQQIDKVSRDDVVRVASQFLPAGRQSLGVVGPLKKVSREELLP